ncbi:hypothetical protein Sa4125_02390 [Aureimonas sp. SA4125]|uniref:hypothetical protein n=1 Tax=Aureimonas sp. SA4125 TaxID=2826993 RepID=UPI001CC5D66C|nr:hypothetical protein [Aureimonas sp. SA4125]BDA82697.1 hypothetical protein Sa4125_02390 [Aureimonas sp. SA4125]
MVCKGVSLVLAMLVAAMLPAKAVAGAWTLPEGFGQVIVSGYWGEAMEAYGSDGEAEAIPLFQKAEINLYAEYGVTDRLTAILRSEAKTYASEEAPSLDAARFGLTGGGARLLVWEGESVVLSAEIVGRVATPFDRRARAEERGGEVDLRLMAGQNFQIGSWSAYADIQGAYRIGIEGRADAFVMDLSLGVRPQPRLLLLAQSFNALALSREGAPVAEPTEHKLQLSAVYDISPRLSLQAGGVATVAGRDALRETALLTAVWLRF